MCVSKSGHHREPISTYHHNCTIVSQSTPQYFRIGRIEFSEFHGTCDKAGLVRLDTSIHCTDDITLFRLDTCDTIMKIQDLDSSPNATDMEATHTTTKEAEATLAASRTKLHVNSIDLVWHEPSNTSVFFHRSPFKRLVVDAALAYRLPVFTVCELTHIVRRNGFGSHFTVRTTFGPVEDT